MDRTTRGAREGGLYAPTLTAAERAALDAAAGRPLLEDEVALVRVLIRRALEEADQIDVRLVGRLIDTLCRLLRTREAVGAGGETLAETLARLGAEALLEREHAGGGAAAEGEPRGGQLRLSLPETDEESA